MKIKTKLYALAIISTLAILLSVGVFIGFQNYTNKILDEQRELIVLRELMFRQNIALSKLVNNNTPVIGQRKVLEDNIIEINKILKVVSEFKILPTLNSNTEKAFSSIGKLDVLLKNAYDKLDTSLDEFMSHFDATDVTYSIKIIDRYKNRSNYTRILLGANNVVKYGFSVELALDAASDILTEQSIIIDSVIESYQKISTIITLSVVAFSIIMSAFFAFSLSNKISKSISILSKSLSIMAKGDFTHDIIINTKDELGHLGKEMSTFQNDLNVSLNRIKNSSEENKKANVGLLTTTADASDVTVDVSLNIESVNNRMKTLAGNIEEANVGMTSIFDFTNTLNNFTTEQMAMVEESTAAITEMIASISSISDLTNNNTDVIKKLELTAVEGDKKLSDTTDIIEEINSTVSDINSMSEIIKSISEQTNLLAMNAAIEAAHAGDAGKGFAVVADEIRKLAEASSLNSQDISKNLDEITHKIEMASVSGVSTREAFTDIYDKIKNVSNALLQVASSTSELDTGGSQILEAMEGLKEISINVQEKSSEMKDVSSSVSMVSSDISNISKSVTEDLAGVYTGFNDVTNAMVSLNDVSDKVEAVSKEINVEVLKFKTK